MLDELSKAGLQGAKAGKKTSDLMLRRDQPGAQATG
jgi:hypothetical protein